MTQFQKLSFVFDLYYHSQIFIQFKNQGNFLDLLVMRNSKLFLIFKFDRELTEIKDKAQSCKFVSIIKLYSMTNVL